MNMKVIISILGVLATLAIVFWLFTIFSTPRVNQTTQSGQPASASGVIKEFTVKAFRFGYDPNKIVVNKGDTVRIIINNTDTLHGMYIPDLNLLGSEIIEFTANKSGEFTWRCTNPACGLGHPTMRGTLIVKD
jgi:heme/copper-type cytochrome/quinol oxidase subunit 2